MLSLVVPVYQNESSLDGLLHAIHSIYQEMAGEMEVIFVVDASPDRCYEILLERLSSCTFPSQLILLTRNYGSFAAIRAGLAAGNGDHFAVMSADLQEPPQLVLEMSRLLRDDQADVVVGVRSSRSDPVITRAASTIFWLLYRRYVIKEMPPGGVDIFGCTATFCRELLKLEERHSSLVAQIFWLGYRRLTVSYERRPRMHGTSAWTLRKKLDYMTDSIFAFTDLPIRLLIRTGALVALVSGCFAVAVIVSRLAGWITVPGYAMTILAIIFFGAVNLFALGIVGSYAWRTYENTKRRPHAITLSAAHFPGRTS